MSLPLGFSSEGLPVGIQLVAPRYHDRRLLSAGAVVESLLDQQEKDDE